LIQTRKFAKSLLIQTIDTNKKICENSLLMQADNKKIC